MCPQETLRKLKQLDAVMLLDDKRTRIVRPDSGLLSDLAVFVEDGEFKTEKLVPFLLVAVNHLVDRVSALEQKFSP